MASRRSAPTSGRVPKSSLLTFEVLSQYFHLPISVVGKELGVCATMLKKICRKNGIPRWPYRQIKSLNRMIASLEAQPGDDESVTSILKTLRYKRENLLGNPHMNEPLLRHRKQFRMITKKNGGGPLPAIPATSRPAQSRVVPGTLDDLAVGVLSSLSETQKPVVNRQPAVAPTQEFYRQPAHYAPVYDPRQAVAMTPEQAQHNRLQASSLPVVAVQRRQDSAFAARQVPQAYYTSPVTHHQQVPRYMPQQPAYAPPAVAAPSWHSAPSQPAPAQQNRKLPLVGHNSLKLPALQFDGPTEKTAQKPQALEPNVMSVQHLLAF